MTSHELATLQRIEEKLDLMTERVTTLIVKEATTEQVLAQQQQELAVLKTAHNKAMGVLTFLAFPGIGTLLWLGIQMHLKKP